jgi:hypothetical protein
MPTSAAILDALYGLLEAEEGSIFRFMPEGTPYLTQATVETRRLIQRMSQASFQFAAELAELIEQQGGVLHFPQVNPADQYLAYLSLKFLLPKLAEAKRNTIERYENALRALKGSPPEIIAVLNNHLAAHRADLEQLTAKP